jgi:MFS family permease
MVGLHRLPCETPSAHSAEVSAKPTRWVLPATILGSSLSLIDGSVVNVALPAIQRDLQTQLATMQWVVNGYMLMLASLILLGGSAGDRFGRRRIFQIGLVGFALASLLCALAPSAGWLIVARLVQGIAAALLVPASLAILGSVYSGDARGRAIGTWAGAAALTTALGPPLGGWLVDAIGMTITVAPLTTTVFDSAPKEKSGIASGINNAAARAGALVAVAALGLAFGGTGTSSIEPAALPSACIDGGGNNPLAAPIGVYADPGRLRRRLAASEQRSRRAVQIKAGRWRAPRLSAARIPERDRPVGSPTFSWTPDYRTSANAQNRIRFLHGICRAARVKPQSRKSKGLIDMASMPPSRQPSL